ncbi:MAG TPA: hypothetical protein VFJ22_16180 [Dermatophilaceae bacterium]|nr:hypothetical protein [Dermatophilaceae bacterium]
MTRIPGSFRLLEDGRLAVVDFGSRLPMPHGWAPGSGTGSERHSVTCHLERRRSGNADD